MSMLKIAKKKYTDGRTKQSFKDSTDINQILKKAARTGTISHLSKYGAQYGDFSDFDFLSAQNMLAESRSIFEALPSEVRREFGNNPAAFFEFANDPKNEGRLGELLPAIAEPGSYFPTVRRGQAPVEPPEAPEEPIAPEDPPPSDP